MSRPKLEIEEVLLEKLPRGKRFLVAVSGGKDSVSLLYACYSIMNKIGASSEVAHVDHGIRSNSKSDAEFVKSLAQKYNFPFHLKQIEKAPSSGNLEAWGRELRYTFFAEVMKENNLDYFLTAHTADDVAETLLMRLISNKETSGIDELDEKRRCIRPLLNIPRSTINEYVEKNNLEYREDITNNDVTYLRNRVRHLVMPVLRDNFDKRIAEVLAYRAGCLYEDTQCLRSLLSTHIATVEKHERFTRAWLRAVKKGISSDAKSFEMAFR